MLPWTKRLVILANDTLVASVLERAEPRLLANALLTHIRNVAKDKNSPAARYLVSVDGDFTANIANLARAAAGINAKTVLLHYPNSRLRKIDDAAERLSLPVVGDEVLFWERIRNEGYAKYFSDHGPVSGHMTDIGKNIYGHFIAEQLLRLRLF